MVTCAQFVAESERFAATGVAPNAAALLSGTCGKMLLPSLGRSFFSSNAFRINRSASSSMGQALLIRDSVMMRPDFAAAFFASSSLFSFETSSISSATLLLSREKLPCSGPSKLTSDIWLCVLFPTVTRCNRGQRMSSGIEEEGVAHQVEPIHGFRCNHHPLFFLHKQGSLLVSMLVPFLKS